jgi:hypothetical protein
MISVVIITIWHYTLKMVVLWDVTTCSVVQVHQNFRGSSWFYYQDNDLTNFRTDAARTS